MGCFSFMCKECKTPINSDSFDGEHTWLFLLKDGKPIESINGPYNSYGAVFQGEGSKEFSMEWGDVVDMIYDNNPNNGIAAVHTKCYTGTVPTTQSDDDPDQGWEPMRTELML